MARGDRMGSDLRALTEGGGRDLQTLQVKLTYVDSQLKGRTSVAFTTFYHVLRMQWFLSLRRPDVNYSNDELDLMNFTVRPEEMSRVVRRLSDMQVGMAPNAVTPSPHMSLMVVLRNSRLGETAYEGLFDTEESNNVRETIRLALDERNGIGRDVLDLLLI
jgi:hypothetical protein